MSKKQKTVMMIGGGIQEVKAVEIAQSAGYKVLVTDQNKNAQCCSVADYSAAIDGRDIEGLIAHTLLNKEKLNILGVFTLTELVTSVAAVSNACGLPGVSLKSVVACQNKALCKGIWLKDGIATPFGKTVRTKEEAVAYFNKLNHQTFVKPVVGFGGVGARKILNKTDLDELFNNNNSTEYLMEELATGSMHDVNAVIDHTGKFVPLGCFDRYFDQELPIETGAVYPSQLSSNLVDEAYELTKNAAQSLGIKWGPIKSDLVLTKRGFQILEMAPRLHGPKGTLWLSSMSGGSNHLEQALRIIIGKGLNVEHRCNPYIISMFKAIDPFKGLYKSIKGVNDALNIDGVEDILIFSDSKLVKGKQSISSKIPGYIFVSGSNMRNGVKIIEKAKRFIKFV